MRPARQALRAAVRAVDHALVPVRRRATIEGVHVARAAARKIGDTISTYDVTAPLLKELGALLKDACGEVRDLHVAGVLSGVKFKRATAALRKAIAGWDRGRPLIDDELEALVATASPKKLLHTRLRKLERRIDALPARVPPRQAHRLRVKTKRARTAVVLIEPEKTKLLKTLKKASAELGKLHDLDAGLVSGKRKKLLHDVAPALEKLRSAL